MTSQDLSTISFQYAITTLLRKTFHSSEFLFQSRDINFILGDLIEHMRPSRNYEKFYNELKIIVNKLVSHTQDFEMLLAMVNTATTTDTLRRQNYFFVNNQ